MLSRHAQVLALRWVAVAALGEYGLSEGTLHFLTHGENTTWRHDGPRGSHLVRVHRPQRHGRGDPEAPIRSELAWLSAIREETDLLVPRPVATPDGRTTVVATVGDLTRVVSVLEWTPGRIVGGSARPVHLRRLGTAMARLHGHADAWKRPEGFTRIHWDREGFLGNAMVYGKLAAADVWPLFPPDLRKRFEAVAERMGPLLDSDPDTGLIHADLHLSNAVFNRDTVALIDFDDSGFGPRIYELAVALWSRRHRDEYAPFRDALVDSYLSERELDVTHLDDYIALRQLAFELWFTGMAGVNPEFAAELDNTHEWSHQILDAVGY